MKQIYFFSFSLFFFSACSPVIKYIGSTNTPTSHIDIFVDRDAIKKNYDIVGKGYVHGLAINKQIEKLQDKVIEKAKKKGSDAVLIQDYYVPNTGAIINTSSRTDSISKGLLTIGISSVHTTGTSGYNIFFLKYRD
jgi:hypothetical protein